MLRKKALPLMACFSHFETTPFDYTPKQVNMMTR